MQAITLSQVESAPPMGRPVDSLAALVERFMAAQDVAERTRTDYGKNVRRFLGWLADTGRLSPDREDVIEYKRQLRASGLAENTVSWLTVAVRQFFQWTESVRLYPNIAAGVRVTRARGFRRGTLAVSQVRDLLAAVPRETLTGKRDFAFLNLLVRTGLRSIEVVRADVGDIKTAGGCPVLYIHGKGRREKDDFVVLTPNTLNPLRAYLTARGAVSDDLPLFASDSRRNRGGRLTTRTIRGAVKRYLRGIDLDARELTAHSLRHTAVTLAIQAGAPVQDAQAMARHRSVDTTLLYYHNHERVTNGAEFAVDRALSGGKE